VLPVRFPNLLVNGSSGMPWACPPAFRAQHDGSLRRAAGLHRATDIKTQQLMEIIKAPDSRLEGNTERFQ